MKPFWIFQHENIGRDREEFQYILSTRKIPYITIQYLEPLWYQKIPVDSTAIAYGSINFIKAMKRVACYPGYFAKFPQLKCSFYYSFLGKHLAQKDYCFTTYAEFLRNKEMFFDKFSSQGLIFLKPDENDKLFTGGLYEFDEEPQKRTCETIYPNELLVVAEPINIYEEYRFVIHNQEVITGSTYKFEFKRINNGPAWDKAQEIALEFNPDPMFVIDIAHTKTGYELLEIGGFSCAGFYNCDKEKIVDAVQIELKKEQNEI